MSKPPPAISRTAPSTMHNTLKTRPNPRLRKPVSTDRKRFRQLAVTSRPASERHTCSILLRLMACRCEVGYSCYLIVWSLFLLNTGHPSSLLSSCRLTALPSRGEGGLPKPLHGIGLSQSSPSWQFWQAHCSYGGIFRDLESNNSRTQLR